MKRKWKLCKWHKLPSYLLIIASYRGEKFNLDRNYYWVYVGRGRKWFQLELSSRVALIKPGGKRASCVHSNVTYSNKITCFTFDMSSLHYNFVLFMCQMCTTVCCSYHRYFAIFTEPLDLWKIYTGNVYDCIPIVSLVASFISFIRLTSFIWFARRLSLSILCIILFSFIILKIIIIVVIMWMPGACVRY